MTLLLYHLTVLPHFFWLLTVSLIFCVGFSGVSLLLPNIRRSVIGIALAPYLSFALLIISSWVVVSLLPNPMSSLKVFSIGFIVFSLLGWIQAIKDHQLQFRRYLPLMMTMAAGTGVLIYFLASFTFQNGLHDEYYHHSIIELFFKTNSFPFLEPYRLHATLSGYHFGLYFPVILVRLLLGTSTENALDIAKIILFISAISSLGILLSRVFSIRIITSLVLTVTALILGPSFFFIDTFSQNVFTEAKNAQLFTPVLFEYAGLTWHGLTFFLAFTTFALISARKTSKISTLPIIGFIVVTIFSMVVINQVFFLPYVAVLGIVGVVMILGSRYRKHFILPSMVFLLSVAISFNWMIQGRATADNRTSIVADNRLNPGEQSKLKIIRPDNRIGIPYLDETKPLDAVSRLSYATIQTPFFWRSLGILWLLSYVLFITHSFKHAFSIQAILLSKSKARNLMDMIRHNLSSTFLVLLLFLLVVPIATYFLLFPTDDLALNKFLRPAFFFLPFILYTTTRTMPLGRRVMVGVLVFLGMISPLYFFITGRFTGFQQYWIPKTTHDQEIVEFFSTKNLDRSQIQSNMPEVLYLLTSHYVMQGAICYEDCGSQKTVDYVITDKRREQNISPKRSKVFENTLYRVYH